MQKTIWLAFTVAVFLVCMYFLKGTEERDEEDLGGADDSVLRSDLPSSLLKSFF